MSKSRLKELKKKFFFGGILRNSMFLQGNSNDKSKERTKKDLRKRRFPMGKQVFVEILFVF